MLSDITILILSVLAPILGVFCFIQGYNIGAKETNKAEIKVETPKKKIDKRKKKKEAEERMRKAKILYENIENYHGDSVGQKEIR